MKLTTLFGSQKLPLSTYRKHVNEQSTDLTINPYKSTHHLRKDMHNSRKLKNKQNKAKITYLS